MFDICVKFSIVSGVTPLYVYFRQVHGNGTHPILAQLRPTGQLLRAQHVINRIPDRRDNWDSPWRMVIYYHYRVKLQALVYDVLPPTSAIIDYAVGLEKLSANGQFFVGIQMAVSL